MTEDKNTNCYSKKKKKEKDEINYITGFTFKGVNPVTKMWQQANYIRERERERGSLTLINNP